MFRRFTQSTLISSLRSLRYLSSQPQPQPPSSSAPSKPKQPAEKQAGIGANNRRASQPVPYGRDTLGNRLSFLVYDKFSAVVTIHQWLKEGKVARKYELNRIVRDLRKLKRYKHALEVCEWMTTRKDMKLLPGDYAMHLDLVSKVRGLESAEKFFLDLPERMREQQPTYTALLHTYVQNNLVDKSEDLMRKMLRLGFLRYSLPYNHMLNLYIKNGQLEKVPGVIRALKQNATPDVVTYNLWLSVCASQNDVESAEKVFEELKEKKIELDWVTYSTLTNLYIKNDQKDKAKKCLKEMEKLVTVKSRVAYSSLLSLHSKLGNRDGLDKTWKNIKFNFRKMNGAEYMSMISSLLKFDELQAAEDLYSEYESLSNTVDCRIPNLLLGVYINDSLMVKAEKFFQKMKVKNILLNYTTYELLTRGHLKEKNITKALDCFKLALKTVKKWKPTDKIAEEIFNHLVRIGDIERAENLLVVLREAGYVTTEIYNLLLQTYEKAGKMPVVIEERMNKDNVQLDQKTRQLIDLTSKLCVAEVSSIAVEE